MAHVAKDLIGTASSNKKYKDSDVCHPITHAVDITEDCGGNKSQRKLVKYVKEWAESLLIEVALVGADKKDTSLSLSWWCDPRSERSRAIDPKSNLWKVIVSFAPRLDITPELLASLVLEHMPKD